MCGICGKLNFDRQMPVTQDELRRMMDIIQHRGPDGEGVYLAGSVGLGHRRLSIIDIDAGSQPMANEDNSVWVVFNGEIYNFQELRSELQGKGHQFKSLSDTEVIVHLYEEYGEDCVNRLQGMFAFAIWDETKQKLFLARDRVGIKPLYYSDTGKSLIFGSEIKSLLTDAQVKRDVNPRALDRFLTYHYLPGNETPLTNIFKLEPGHYMSVQSGKIQITQYWDLNFVTPPLQNFNDAVSSLKELLDRTVKNHMISDVPVGVLLSGGVDSTGILHYAANHSDKPINTFTMGFSGNNFADERPYAKLAARKYNTVHHDISMSANDFMDFLPRYVWHMEEWVCEPPAVALYFVSQLAKTHSVKVLLSGEGGDEAFAGYPNYRNLMALEKLKALFGPAKGLLKSSFKALASVGINQINNYSDLVDYPLAKYYLSRTARPNLAFNRIKYDLYNKNFAEALKSSSSDWPTGKLFEKNNGLSTLNSMLYVDTKTWLPDDLLVKADKMTMATSVELRVPMLDHQVLEFAASLPEEYKVNGWQLKRILKAALAEHVPQEILNRKKTGFPVPYDSWMRHEMKDFVFDAILNRNAALNAYLCKKTVNKLLHDFQVGSGHSKEVFSLLVFELWHKQFL
ncbi:asparagine synthase (glutamine-hydrolysing) [biofilm metagenome]